VTFSPNQSQTAETEMCGKRDRLSDLGFGSDGAQRINFESV